MASGLKSKSKVESKTKIPPWISEPSRRSIMTAENLSRQQIPQYSGPTIAELSPLQQAVGQGNFQAGQAFGFIPEEAQYSEYNPLNEMGELESEVGGITGYSPNSIYEEIVSRMNKEKPGIFEYIEDYYNRRI